MIDKFQYKIVSTKMEEIETNLLNFLNTLGMDGWELVTKDTVIIEDVPHVLFIFKKRIESSSPFYY